MSLRKGTQRIVDTTVDRLGILKYDEDNNYPHRINTIINSSGRTTACEQVLHSFIYGKGFADESLAKAMANDEQTYNDLLEQAIQDFSRLRSFALHVTINQLGETVSFENVPIDYVRLGANKGEYRPNGKIAVYDNWDGSKGKIKKDEIKFYDAYSEQAIETLVNSEDGVEGHNGYIFYFSMDGFLTYPLAWIEPEAEAAISDGLVGTYTYKSLYNGFAGSKFLTYSQLIDKEVREDVENAISEAQGAESAGGVTMMWGLDKEALGTIDVQAENTDKQFTATEASINERIRKLYFVPSVLLSEQVAGKLGSSTEFKDAQHYYNVVTSRYRVIMTRIFSRLLEGTMLPEDIDTTILEFMDFETKDVPSELLDVLTPNEKRELIGYDSVDTGQEDKPALATVIGVGGVQSMVQILESPTLTPAQKQNLIVQLFGLTVEDAQKLTDEPVN